MHAAVGEERERLDAGLHVLGLIAEGEVVVGREGGGAERGDEDGLGPGLRIREDAVGPLDDGREETAPQEQVLEAVCSKGVGVLHAEIDVLLLRVGLDDDGEELALVAPVDPADRTAYRRGNEDGRPGLVGEDGGAGEHPVAFPDQQPRRETVEIRGAQSDGAGYDGTHDFPGRNTLQGDVEALFQIDSVGHYKVVKIVAIKFVRSY